MPECLRCTHRAPVDACRDSPIARRVLVQRSCRVLSVPPFESKTEGKGVVNEVSYPPAYPNPNPQPMRLNNPNVTVRLFVSYTAALCRQFSRVCGKRCRVYVCFSHDEADLLLNVDIQHTPAHPRVRADSSSPKDRRTSVVTILRRCNFSSHQIVFYCTRHIY